MVLPKEVKEIIAKLNEADFEAYAVGGCTRDFILDRIPYDWDITTNAKPDQIQKVFKKSIYENEFGTVAVNTESENAKLKIIEITTYRIEEKYTDKRHPDIVKFTSKLEDDLARRDFTVNAIAYDGKKFIDPYDGQIDIKNKIIRTVGEPNKRFNEDALRLMRAIRLAVQLDFTIESETIKAIKANAGDIVAISKERIRDELIKIFNTEYAKAGIEMLRLFGLLKHIMPELEEGIGVTQNKHHIYTVWEHNLRALDWAATSGYKLEVRMASLLHDVGKPRAKRG